MRGPVLRIERAAAPGVLRITGQLDRSNARVLLEAVRLAAGLRVPGATIELDCSGLAFLDASGAETLARAARDLAPAADLVVVEPGPLLGRLLRLLARTTPSLTVVAAHEDILSAARPDEASTASR